MGARIATIAGLLIVLMAAGCGGSDDDTLTKSEFVEQANAICTKARKEAKSGKGTLGSEVVTALRAETSEIEALGAPEGDEAQIEAILDGARKVVGMVEANSGKGTPEAGTKLIKTEKLAHGYGLEACLVFGEPEAPA